MHKHILVPTCAGLDLIRDEAHTVSLQALDGSPQVRNLQADVVEAFAALGNEFRDR